MSAITGPSVLRWLARGLSVLLIALVVMMILGERPDPIGIIRSTRGLVLLFPIGVCVGLALAWKWELAGSLVSLASMVLFALMHFLLVDKWLRLSGFMLFMLPAVLFLASWFWHRTAIRIAQLPRER